MALTVAAREYSPVSGFPQLYKVRDPAARKALAWIRRNLAQQGAAMDLYFPVTGASTIYVDHIREYVVGHGIDIDGVGIKDYNIIMTDNHYIGGTWARWHFYDPAGAVTPVGRGGVSTDNYCWVAANAAVDYGSQQSLIVGGGLTIAGSAAPKLIWHDGADAAYIQYVHATDAMYFATVNAARVSLSQYGNLRISGGAASADAASGTYNLQIANGTPPTEAVADLCYFYSDDLVAGNACPHFRTENGTVIILSTTPAALVHTHDDRYYTETEVNTWRNGVDQTEMGYLDGVTGDIQTALDARCLEAVFGTAIGTGLILDTATLKVSAILQKYHAIDPSANVQALLGAADYAAILALLSGQAGAAFSWNSQNLTSVGTIGCGTITVADGSSINLQEDISFTGATTENIIKMLVNLADALSIQEGGNKYITFDTVAGEEDIIFFVPLDIRHTASTTDDHSLEIDADAAGYGDVKAIDIDYITGALVKGEDEGIILINIDRTHVDATGGDVFGLEVLATDGSPGVYGLKIGPEIGPIHQDSGDFEDPTTATDNTPDTNVNDMMDENTGTPTDIFTNVNEYIIIGAAAAFQDLELILTTPSSKNIKPTFWYSIAGAGQFTQFTPVDGTDGCKHTGVISWDASDLTNHVAADAPPVGTGTFDIKIIRTRATAAIATPPELGYARVATTTEYVWDESGDVNIHDFLASGTLGVTGAITGPNVSSGADPGHTHTVYQAADAELAAIAGLMSAANKIPYFTGSESASLLDLATTVGDPGSDTTLVSEQGIREALDAITGIPASLFDADTFLYATNDDTPVATSPANVLAALSGHAAAGFDWNNQNFTSVGSIACTSIGATGNISAQGGNIYVGVDKTTGGTIHLYGEDAAASNPIGGAARFYSSDTYEGDVDYWTIHAYNDDLEFKADGNLLLTMEGTALSLNFHTRAFTGVGTIGCGAITSSGAVQALTFEATTALGAGTPVANTIYKENIPKARINFSMVGGGAINGSFNVSSITDIGVGRWDVNWDTDFANTTYTVTGINNASLGKVVINGLYTTKVDIQNYGSDAIGAVDSSIVSLIAIGDQP